MTLALAGVVLTVVAAVQWTIGGATVGLETPLVLLALPFVIGVIAWVLLREGASTATARRSRSLMLVTRVVVVTCLVVAAAGPFVVSETTAVEDPRVTMLVDESDSMSVFDVDVDRLAAAIEREGIPVQRSVVGRDNESAVGDGIVSSVVAGGNVLLVTDGRVTTGRSLESAAEFAARLNATVSTVNIGSPATERAVRVTGPPKTTAGVASTFRVAVDGVATAGAVPVTVTIDGETVLSTTVDGTGAVTFEHTFAETGIHRIVASIDVADGVSANDVAYRTVSVVERPDVLYVSRGEYPFRDLLGQLYDVTTAQEVPSNLSPYTTVVIQDVRAADVGDVGALRSFVVDGNGLVVTGGLNAFERGEYAQSELATLLPVRPGETRPGGVTVVLTVDVSGSTTEGMGVQKALALDVLDQLDDEDRVGIVAFEQRAYRVADVQQLGPNRAFLEDRIRRLTSSGGTNIGNGLRGAGQLLGETEGNVILLTDGFDNGGGAVAEARTLAAGGTRVIAIGVGPKVNEALLEEVATASGGAYLRSSERSRLRVLFGDAPQSPTGKLTVVDQSHFITAGVEPTARPSETHDVSVKQGADFLVAAGDGRPALASWQYGLGRVVTITAYGSDGSLDGLLGSPDSLLLSRSVNWAVGDPERKSTGLISLADTRLGEPTRAVYVGDQRPDSAEMRFSQVAPGRFEATVVPTEQGFATVLNRPYAVDYPVETSAFGVVPTLDRLVEVTDGRTFEPNQVAAIADYVRQRATVVRVIRTSLGWPFLVTALVVFLVDVAARRLHVYGPGDTSEV